MLEALGCRADTAQNGREVLDALRLRHYDVVLMDVQMPEMDGWTATRRICDEFPPDRRPRIVAMTANVLEEDLKRCTDAGMSDYVCKPVRRFLPRGRLNCRVAGPRVTSARRRRIGAKTPNFCHATAV